MDLGIKGKHRKEAGVKKGFYLPQYNWSVEILRGTAVMRARRESDEVASQDWQRTAVESIAADMRATYERLA